MRVAERVLIPARSEMNVPIRIVHGANQDTSTAWTTECTEIKSGVYSARVVLGRTAEAAVRVKNQSNSPAVLCQNDGLGIVYPVEVLRKQKSAGDESTHMSKAMKVVK